MKILSVEKPKKYNICFSDSFSNLKSTAGGLIKHNARAFIIADANTAALFYDAVAAELSSLFSSISGYVIKAGEQSKNFDNVQNIFKKMIGEGYGRDDVIIALGGGVVGDLSGFCAAIYMRGIDLIQIPTTLVSQIDSSIGGKTAVDMDSYKNMIGAFHSPILVYENSSCLKTLPPEQFLSGMGEVLKSALLGDKELWSYLNKNLRSGEISKVRDDILIRVLYDTCLIKKKVVEEDPFDTGKRAILNLGHTVGHAVEKCADFKLTHGACVALGTVCAAYISRNRGLLSDTDFDEILSYIKDLGLYTKIPEGISLNISDIITAISKDKKNSADGLKFILIKEIGRAEAASDVSKEEITDSLGEIGIF